jgi:hypothetical protein
MAALSGLVGQFLRRAHSQDIYRQDYGLLNGHCPTTLFKAQYTSKRST